MPSLLFSLALVVSLNILVFCGISQGMCIILRAPDTCTNLRTTVLSKNWFFEIENRVYMLKN